MPGPDPIENAFVTRAKAIAGMKNAQDYEGEKIPTMPAVTMHFLGPTAIRDHQTGPAQEVDWGWRVRLYVPLKSRQGSDFKRAQESLKALVPPLLKLVRDDPSLGGACDNSRLLPTGEEPDYDTDQRHAFLDVVLVATAEEV